MIVRKYEIFIDLASTLNYTETANNFFTTQSNISKQIIALEDELGVQLFDRSRRRVRLTSVGQTILHHAMAVVAEDKKLRQVLKNYKYETDQSLLFYSVPTLPRLQTFATVMGFIKENPSINIQIKEVEAAKLITHIPNEPNDISFFRTFSQDSSGFESLLSETDQFVALLPKSHSLAHLSIIPLELLKDENFVILNEDTTLDMTVINLCRSVGFDPKIIYSTNRINIISDIVLSQMSVSILPETIVNKKYSPDLITLPIYPNMESYLSFYRRKNNPSDTSDIFWNYMRALINH